MTGLLVPSGGILVPMLFQVWSANVENDSMLQVWPERLTEVKDRYQCVYSKPLDRSILPFSFQSGTEATSFAKARWLAQTASHPKSKLPWILIDPQVFNCGGVDMILVRDESVVGVSVTIAGPSSDMTEFFQAWKSIAQENSLTMEGVTIVLDDSFAHRKRKTSILPLKDVYRELWSSILDLACFKNWPNTKSNQRRSVRVASKSKNRRS
ncbi:hypothetical protein AC1031_009416 [Aphanomyces cochlioides]|nr:hypothetical protein AC1031_009416 [Aphanomyces cochlioides]